MSHGHSCLSFDISTPIRGNKISLGFTKFSHHNIASVSQMYLRFWGEELIRPPLSRFPCQFHLLSASLLCLLFSLVQPWPKKTIPLLVQGRSVPSTSHSHILTCQSLEYYSEMILRGISGKWHFHELHEILKWLSIDGGLPWWIRW